MRIAVPIMIQDPMLTGNRGMARLVERPYVVEAYFLDGPVSRRVAVVAFDAESGARSPGVPFVPPTRNRGGRFRLANEDDIYAPDFIAVSVFGTILRTMAMFEEADTLGRDLVWGFDGPQLLVVPRAGEWANAFYERESHSLQFFYFADPNDGARKVYTALSRDIVCHETGHAILDGIAPRLYDALTPESLALHEAVADLVALVMAFRCSALARAVLAATGGSIADAGAFSSIAEEFGHARYNLGALRNLASEMTMDDVDHSRPHDLSQVLSAALYSLMMHIYLRWWRKYSGAGAPLDPAASGKALAVAADHFKRMVFRALDYLPPAEVSFADYARAILAADQASHPDSDHERQFIRLEFVKRKIVPDAAALDVATDFAHPAVAELDMEALVAGDWLAYDFANRNRELLSIPADVPFQVEPRLVVSKLFYHEEGERTVKECLLKVWWQQAEPNRVALGFPSQRLITVGTTLAIDWESRRVRALLTTDRRTRPAEGEAQAAHRDAFLGRLAASGALHIGPPRSGPDGKPLQTGIAADVLQGKLRVRALARLLHIIDGE